MIQSENVGKGHAQGKLNFVSLIFLLHEMEHA